MSYNDFDYNNALEAIKASLFDIYEHQERIIGSLENEELRQLQINNYVTMKDKAINLIESIEKLYNKNSDSIDSSISDEDSVIENSNETSEIVDEDLEKPSTDSVLPEFEIEENNQEEAEDNFNDEPIDIDSDMEQEENSTVQVKDQAQIDIDENRNLFYLDDRNGKKPNFAYVPLSILDRIKQNAIKNITLGNNSVIKDNKYYKDDSEKPKGIIVRSDQFMKLNLSRYRQETVINDAKSYRINQAKASMLKLEEQQNEYIST